MEVPELLTVREVAAMLKISPESVARRFQNLAGNTPSCAGAILAREKGGLNPFRSGKEV